MKCQSALHPRGHQLAFAVCDSPSAARHDELAVSVARWERIPRIRRPLVFGTHPVFMQLQALHPRRSAATATDRRILPTATGAKQLRALSQVYRRRLLAHIQSLRNEPGAEDELELCGRMHTAWHLAEILFVMDGSGGGSPSPSVTVDLVDWISSTVASSDTERLQSTAAELLQHVAPRQHTEFWWLLERLLLRGLFAEAEKVLRAAGSTPELSTLQQLLARCPSRRTFSSEAEWSGRWRSWRMDVRMAQEQQPTNIDNDDCRQQARLLQILAGHEQTIVSLLSDNWRECLVAFAVHCHPLATATDIADILARVKASCNISTNCDDSLHVAILEMDVVQVVRHATAMDAWLGTHLTDFVAACGLRLDMPIDTSSSTLDMDGLREFTVLAYGEILMASDDLWRVGADYLGGGCRKFGRVYLSLYLPRIVISDDATLRTAVDICTTYRLDAECAAILRMAAKRKLTDGRFYAAASFSAQAGDDQQVTRIADLLIRRHVLNQDGSKDPSGDEHALPPPHLVANERMQFLHQYLTLHTFIADKDDKEAARVLTELLTTNVTPPCYIPMLLLDSIPLLEAPDLVLDEHDTFEVLRCLEDVTLTHHSREFIATMLPSGADEDTITSAAQALDIVRHAATRNLSRAFLASA